MTKVFINDLLIFEFTELDKKALSDKFNKDDIEQRIKDIIGWAALSFATQAKEEIKKAWLPILFKRLKTIPTDDTELLTLIFSQPDYKDKDQKDFKKDAEESSKFKVD